MLAHRFAAADFGLSSGVVAWELSNQGQADGGGAIIAPTGGL
jgi:hypothetical protein